MWVSVLYPSGIRSQARAALPGEQGGPQEPCLNSHPPCITAWGKAALLLSETESFVFGRWRDEAGVTPQGRFLK